MSLITLQALIEQLPGWGDRRAIGLRGDFGFRWWSYERLHASVLRAAASLRRRSLAPGERVLLWAPNSPEWAAYLLGAAWLGIVVVPIDASATLDEVRQILTLTGARLLLLGPHQPPGGLPVASERIAGLERTPPADNAIALPASISVEDPAVILFTAGTSGKPRRVVLTHGNLMCQVRHFGYWRPVIRMIPTRLLAISPLSHVQGLLLGVCVPLSLGMTVAYTQSIEPLHLQRTVREGGIRLLSTVPRVLALLEQSLRVQGGGWRLRRRVLGARFRAVLVGGATLPRDAEVFWRRLGCVIVQGYGATETAAFATVNRPLFGTRGSIGLPVHCGSIRLSDDGEILVRGPHLTPAYLGDESPKMTHDGFLRTGDMATQDRRGRLFFLGRREDRIVTAEGHTLHPDAIERELRGLEGIADAVVFGVAVDGLEQVHATLVLDALHDAATLIQRANDILPVTHRIRSWSVWPDADFPRGALHKVRRQEVVATVQAQRSTDRTSPMPMEDSIEAAMADPDQRRRLRRLVPFFRKDTAPGSFEEIFAKSGQLGLDSIEAAELMTMLHELPDPSGPAPAPLGTAATEFPPPSNAPRGSPRWQRWPGAGLLRLCVQTILLDVLLRGAVRVRTRGTRHLRGVQGPVLFVFDPAEREHPVEFLALLRALPVRFRRTLVMLVGDRILFESYFFLKPEDSAWRRWYVALLVRFGVPCVLPFVVSPGGTVQGIRDSCGYIDHGFSPIVTWLSLSAAIACETQVDIVPVRLSGPRRGWLSADVGVRFCPPIRTGADLDANQIFYLVQTHLKATKSPSVTRMPAPTRAQPNPIQAG